MHHSLHTLLTGEANDYLARYADDPVEKLMRVLAQGFAYEGKGAPEALGGLPVYGLPWSAFIVHNQNHDQVGNRPGGDRLINLVKEERAAEVAHALLLASPFVPMLWMGEEEGERGPFHYFCDVTDYFAEAVRKGRKDKFGKMFDDPDGFPDPNDPRTMDKSRPFTASESGHAHR